MTLASLSRNLRLTLTFAFFSLFANASFADGHGSMEMNSGESQGWFYIGEFNHSDNLFQMSYFNATSYPQVGQRLIANRAVNMRSSSPTNQGVLGEKIGIILKNHTLVVTELKPGSMPDGVEDVWVKGFVEQLN